MEIKKVGVLGCGTMGAGIVQACAQSGYPVSFTEISDELIEKGKERISQTLSAGVEKGKLTEQQCKEVMGRIMGTTNIDDLKDCDIVIEAVIEDLEEKKRCLRKLDSIVGAETILASNTSCLSITEMASATNRPDKVVGLHFFNPAPAMKLVEVVRGLQTSKETLDRAINFSRSLGKEPVVTKDAPGFIVNALLIPYLNQAIQAYDDGLATREDIDNAVRLGLGYPMGPLALLDLIGLDVCLQVGEAMYRECGDKSFAPPPLLRRMVRSGWLGRKSGRGFYEYK